MIAERRGLPLSVVVKEAEAAIQNPTPEPVEAIAEGIAHRRQLTVPEVLAPAREVPKRAKRNCS